MASGAIGNTFKLKNLFVGTESTFNEANITVGPASRVAALEMSWTPSQDYVERDVQMDVLGVVAGSVGGKGGKITFKVPVHGLGTPNLNAAGADATVGEPLATILQGANMLRLQQHGKKSHTTQTSSATALALPTGAGNAGDFGVGNADGAPFAGVLRKADFDESHYYPLMVRMIPASVANDAQTLAPPLSIAGAPVTLTSGGGDEILGADVYYPNQTLSSTDNAPIYLTFIAGGQGYYYTFTGCRGMLKKISGDGRKTVTMEFEFEVSSWSRESSSVYDSHITTDIHPQITAIASPFYWKAAATASTPIAGFELDTGTALTGIVSTEAADGNAGFQMTALKPVLKVKPYLSDQWITDFQNAVQDIALIQIGNTGGRTFAIALPYAQITKFPAEVDQGGVVGHEVEFTGFSSTGTGPLAPLYIAFY